MGKVTVRDFDGNIISSFWQYGQMDWELFHGCLNTVIFSTDSWAIFHYDEHAPGRRGAICTQDRNEYPAPGTYIILKPDGNPTIVYYVVTKARKRHPTISNTQTRTVAYRRRTRARDPCCLITRLEVFEDDFSRFRAAHIFPRAYDIDWANKGYPSLITDPAPNNEMGGSKKIDSIQNMLLLRSDLHDAWDNYKFAVNPDRGHVVIPFTGGYSDIAGKVLKLDHINNPNHRPLDTLFRDHFLQCVLKNMKGEAEPTWDYEDTFGDGSMDLSQEVWASDSGQAHLELEIADRLYDLRVAQEAGS